MKTENLSTIKSRLATYRARHAEARNQSPRGWKGHIYGRAPLAVERANNVRGTQGQIFSDTLEQYGDIVENDKNGWFADNWQSDTINPAVTRLRTARGTLYIPCTYCTGWDGTIHYINDAERVPKGADESAHNEAQREALRSAQHYAEREAESAREDDAKFQAEQQTENARETITESRQAARALAAEIRSLAGCGPNVRATLRDKLKALRQASAAAHEEIKLLNDNYWHAVE